MLLEVFSMDYAVSRGVVICIEPLSKKETKFITNISEALQLVELVDHPAIGYNRYLSIEVFKLQASIRETVEKSRAHLRRFIS